MTIQLYVLAPSLLALAQPTPLSAALLGWCRDYLQGLVDNQPQPPADWSRPVPGGEGHRKEWALLKAFLESPDERVFEYRKNQALRDELERAIRSATIDLRTETIRKGLPHTLRIVRTQAAYERETKRWNENRELLEKVMGKTR